MADPDSMPQQPEAPKRRPAKWIGLRGLGLECGGQWTVAGTQNLTPQTARPDPSIRMPNLTPTILKRMCFIRIIAQMMYVVIPPGPFPFLNLEPETLKHNDSKTYT